MPQILLISSLCNDVCDVTKVGPHQGPVPCTKVIKKRMFFCLKKKVKKKFGGQTWPYLLDLRVSKVVQSSPKQFFCNFKGIIQISQSNRFGILMEF